ncbi:MAG: hypothetical protein U5K38_11605 [Woeseiaceae bacterium]|nr:hypothetical protein [Woeseiaceae bacterium]
MQGLSPGELIDACVETLDPAFCANTPRTSSGQLDTVQNRLQNLGSIEASGVDIAFNYLSPETSVGAFTLDIAATHLNEYKEITNNPDGSQSVNDLTGQGSERDLLPRVPGVARSHVGGLELTTASTVRSGSAGSTRWKTRVTGWIP